MAQSAAHLTQSRFFTPAFNAAVFDGPVRIYFAQHQEDLALKVYLKLQHALSDAYTVFRQNFRQHGQTIFLMLYPNPESFARSVATVVDDDDAGSARVVCERLGVDHVVAVRGPLVEDAQYEDVFSEIKGILGDLGISLRPVPSL